MKLNYSTQNEARTIVTQKVFPAGLRKTCFWVGRYSEQAESRTHLACQLTRDARVDTEVAKARRTSHLWI